MKQSVNFIKNLIAESIRADPIQRKQQMFGGDADKEQAFRHKQEELKEHFQKRVYNLNAQKEGRVINNKLQKLVALIRKSSDPCAVDVLVYDIKLLLQSKAVQVQHQLNIVKRNNEPNSLDNQLASIVEECNVQENITRSTRQINLLKKSNKMSQKDAQLLSSLHKEDQGLQVLEKNRKLLDQLLDLERNLIVNEKAKTYAHLRREQTKFERKCSCHEKKDSKSSDIAKHFLYHRPNPKLKWSVQSLQ